MLCSSPNLWGQNGLNCVLLFMKVLLINNFFYRKGGSEAVFFNTAELLKNAGHEVVFFSIENEKNINVNGHEYFVGQGGNLTKIRNYFCNSEAARKLDEVLTKENPDLAHVHLFWGGISPSIFAVLKKHSIPLVHTVHDYRMVCPAYTFRNGKGEVCEQCKGGHFIRCFINRCSKCSIVQSTLMTAEMYYRNRKWHPAKELDGIIYVSNFAKQKHEEFDPQFAKVPNMVLYNFTNVGEKYPPIEKDGGYFLYYGRLSYEKGIGTLVEAFAKHPELSLKVVGTGPIEADLKKKRYTNVEFVGYKSGDDLFNLVRNARFVCVPSEWYENNPMTIVEAYSMGVPVIGARIGGIPEIVDDGKTGFLFNSTNIASLAEAIEKSKALNEKEYKLMKQNVLAFAMEHFSGRTYPEHLITFYKEIINKYGK